MIGGRKLEPLARDVQTAHFAAERRALRILSSPQRAMGSIISSMSREPDFLEGIVDDGRPLLSFTGVALVFSGAFALFLSIRREFLPHDVDFLGMGAAELCRIRECRIVRFMFHDRVAFGGSLIAIGTLYLWLASFPLRAGHRWAWSAFASSGTLGFASFLAYLGYGYLDSWHGVATLALLPGFLLGLWLTGRRATTTTIAWVRDPEFRNASVIARIGRGCLVATGFGMMAAGLTILMIGMTQVFVATDLSFIGATRDELARANPRLIPLIAHDRAGFGGGLASAGILVTWCAWYARPSRSFWQAFAIAGLTGFGAAIAVHFAEGYTTPIHLAPAIAGAALFVLGLALEVAGSSLTRPRNSER
jgi:hypothetical protein